MKQIEPMICCAVSVAGGYMISRAVRRFLPPRRGRIRRAVPAVVFAAALVMPTWVADGNPLYYLPCLLAVFALCYQGSLPARMVTGVIFYEWIITWSMLVDTRAILPYSESSWGAALWKLAMWAAVCLFIRRLTKDRRPPCLPARLWALLGVLALAPLFAELSFSIWDVRLYTSGEVNGILDAAAYTMLPFIFAASLALLAAALLLSRHEALEQEHRLAEMREVYYQSLRREQEQVRRLRHDMNNHLTALSGILENENGNNERAVEYLRGLRAASGAHAGHFCDNETVNIVLSAKAAEMEQAGLTADFAVRLPEKLPVREPDLCALFGNALDNAIEAAQGADDKRITVRARADRGLLMLRVLNAYAGARAPDQAGLFGTTKADKASHGFGLRGMREIAARYGGTLEAAAEGGSFELIVCMPLQGGKAE